jgi:tRNA nucleotidyltransferase (CCA-adding enzyme)
MSQSTQITASGWEHFSHGSDIGVRGFGPTQEAAFQQVARGLTAVVTDPDSVRPSQPVQIACDAPTDDGLLFDWLNALIYEMATRRMLFNAFDVTIQNGRLTATAWGEPVDRTRHEPAVEIKGATYTSLLVERRSDGTWRAGCVVDI